MSFSTITDFCDEDGGYSAMVILIFTFNIFVVVELNVSGPILHYFLGV